MLTRRGFIVASTAIAKAPPDAPSADVWSRLLRELEDADRVHADALAALTEAEELFFRRPRTRRRNTRRKLRAAQRAEGAASDARHSICLVIARTKANGRTGLITKLRLLAEAYGVQLDYGDRSASDDPDLLTELVLSLARDFGIGADAVRS